MEYSFKYFGRADAAADKYGAVHFGEKFRSLWPGDTMWATGDIDRHGLFIACFEALPDQDEYRAHRRERYERLLREGGTSAEQAYRAAQVDIVKHIAFKQTPILKGNNVQLGSLVRRAQLANPLVWTGMPVTFAGIGGVELRSAADLERALADFAEEHKDNKRMLWPYS